VTIPAGTAPGFYSIGAQADADGSVRLNQLGSRKWGRTAKTEMAMRQKMQNAERRT